MSIFRSLGNIARDVAPLAQAVALFASGGTAATLGKVGLAANILGTAASGNGTQQGQAVARSVPSTAPMETSTSGSTDIQNLYVQPAVNPLLQNAAFQQANMIAPPLTPTPRQSMQPTPARGVAGFVTGVVSGAAPMIIDMFTGEPKKLVVTRKLKNQVKRSVDLLGIEATAEGMGVDPEVVTFILLKKMRNDGAYVTKAAVRKTSSTLRKMKRLCDMYDDLRPAAKRRAPVRKSSQTITNVR